MEKDRQLVIVGAGETAEIAYEYFTHDSPYEVAAFSVEREYLEPGERFGLPVVPFDELEARYPPTRYEAFVAVSYTQLNRVRKRLFEAVKARGYRAASYVSSAAFCWRTVEIGENCFIFEDNVVQHGVRIGDNVILWSGNHIGHRTQIGDHTYVSSHVVVSGYCEIGSGCFLGVNSCLGDRLKVGADCVLGAGAVLVRDAEPGKVYVGNPARPLTKSSFESFQVPEDRP